MALAVFDYVVLAVALLASAAIGLYYRLTGGKQQTVQVRRAIIISGITVECLPGACLELLMGGGIT
jgi:hypothetical protein